MLKPAGQAGPKRAGAPAAGWPNGIFLFPCNATLAEFPIVIFLWEFPLNSHLRRRESRQLAISLNSSESRTSGHAAANHQFRAGDVARRVRSEE
jgi:hypothetical protein